MPDIHRRDFLKLTTTALLTASGFFGLDALVRFWRSESGPAVPTQFDLGSAQAYPPGTQTLLPDIPAVLIHDESGFTALSLVCTHLGCTVDPDSNGFVCLCHGSRYDELGRVLHGPAEKALRSLRVEITADDHLWVFLA